MKDLKDGYELIISAHKKIMNAAQTTTHQGDHATLSTCSYHLDRALRLIELVGDLIQKYKMFP